MKNLKSCLAAVLALAAATAFSAEPLLLQWGTIDTSGTSARAESAALKVKVAKKAAAARKRKASDTERAAYVVQFPGPVTGEWRTWLESSTQVRGYLPEFAYLVWATATEMEAIAANPDVFWTGEWKNEYKTARAGSAAPSPAARSAAPARWMQIGSLLTGDGGAADLRARLEALPADVRSAFPRLDGSSAVAFLTDAQIGTVASWPDVEWIEPKPEPRLCNDQAARDNMLNVSNAWAALSSGGLGLTGAGQIVAVADTGLDMGSTNDIHADFAGRVIAAYGWTNGNYKPSASWMDTHSHGTHVCGSILGSGAKSSGQYKGMAHEARLVFQGMGYNLRGLPDDTRDLLGQACDAGARIHSDSWGYGTNYPGQYNYAAVYVDNFTWENQNFLAVIAAGNDGVDANEDGVIDRGSVSCPGTSKNCLCVGAAENYRSTGGYATNTYGVKWPSEYPADPIRSDKISSTNVPQGLAAFSARGPTLDGRFKPDIVAPGTDVISARSRASTNTRWAVVSSNTNYLYMGGTSMATPLTSGSLALVRQWLVERQGIPEPPAALMKALLVNGARDMTPGQYGTGAAQEITARPDFSQGFGHVDLCNSLDPGDGNFLVFATNTIAATYGDFETNLLVGVSNAGTYRITLAWQDYPGAPAAAKTLVNDLDLIVISPSGTRFYPNGLDTSDNLNNIESVEFTAAETGPYTVRVYGYTIAETVPHGGQPFALVMSGPVTGEPEAAAPRFAVSSYKEYADFGDDYIFDFETLLFVKGWPEPGYDITSSLPDGAWDVADSYVSFTPDSTNDVTFTCTATNANGTSTCTLTVAIVAEAPSVSVSCNETLSALVGSDVEFTVSATGIPAPGLSVASDPEVETWFDDSDGEFLFQPTAPGTHTFTFTATNLFGSASATVTVFVSSSAVTVPALAVTNVAATSALATWTPCTGVSTYTLQLASDDQFSSGGEETELLSENFSAATGTGQINNPASAFGTSGWAGSYVFANDGAIRISSKSNNGYIESPWLTNTAAGASVSVVYSSMTWTNDGTSVVIDITEDGTTYTDAATNALGNAMVARTNVFSLSGNRFRVRWQSSVAKKRFLLDDIAISSSGGSSGGSLILSTNVSSTSHAFTDLAPSNTYFARVKGAYAWSDTVEFTTGGEPPALTVTPATYSYEVKAGDPCIEFTVTASGVPAPTLTATCTEGAHFFFGNNQFLFYPNTAGTYHFVFTADNGVGSPASGTVTVTVEPISAFEQWMLAHNASGHAAADVASNGHSYWENYLADVDPDGEFLAIALAETPGYLAIENASRHRDYQLVHYTNLLADPDIQDIGPGSDGMTVAYPVDGTFFARIRAGLPLGVEFEDNATTSYENGMVTIAMSKGGALTFDMPGNYTQSTAAEDCLVVLEGTTSTGIMTLDYSMYSEDMILTGYKVYGELTKVGDWYTVDVGQARIAIRIIRGQLLQITTNGDMDYLRSVIGTISNIRMD